MAKNIVICCDGTGNKLSISDSTNVIHLYSCLELSTIQVAYYSPGVGTIVPTNTKGFLNRNVQLTKDKVSATSLHSNVIDAYVFLMDSFNEGDKIYLFGFSRGAYTVRMLSGVLEMFGLLHSGNTNHLRYILEVYSTGDKMFQVAKQFKMHFAKNVEIEFIGVWDTVVSMGSLIKFYKGYPYSRQLNIAKNIRHAVSIDERRKHFDFTPINQRENNTLKEVYFAGVHSDIGGGYPEEGLSKISLEWMFGEANKHGLIFNKHKVEKVLYTTSLTNPEKNLDYKADIHDSLTLVNRLLDFIPRFRFTKESMFNWSPDFRIWPRRKIDEGSIIHESVFKKMDETSYKPPNIPHEYIIERTTKL
ncbi:DUF2235 domain-containing protein [Arcicella sp. DC2W]|uniref:DUF2235 domain-containing protein n=1 Tax=Arcicella gelida TaxID=2984195 RepID=A0ABU5S2S6_9BACT|nr:DUF2235 domain-containing protein [Arcicella sp. DC2W]MEA5402779.1 DUF2235 domain-containing protein [Arcicella sp. DC2W]